ncbi:MAG: 3-hydroxyacyl-ACP dehydratase [Ferruginibacter sp.]
MLLNDFFTINGLQVSGTDVTATIIIDPAHKIFEGHFPGQPVVPGVCQMQMLKEIMEMVTEKKLDVVKAYDMKFLAVIDPSKNDQVSVSIKYAEDPSGGLQVTGSLFKDELQHFKFKGLLNFQH